MPALNFKRMFVSPIRRGLKNHTIRADRKIPIKAGDRLYLYCGLRHKGAFRILPEPVTCTRALPIRIRLGVPRGPKVVIADEELSRDEMEALAIADGFPNWPSMALFWINEHGDGKSFGLVNFSGQIIHWDPPSRRQDGKRSAQSRQ